MENAAIVDSTGKANRPAVTFMADHMLGKLGKYLRIIGYDAAWDTQVRTHALIAKANAEGRFFLTRNSHLPHQFPKPNQLIMIGSTDPVCQLAEVVEKLKLDRDLFLFSKCIRCNVVLDDVLDKKEIKAGVHPNVYQRYDQFYRCPSCRTIFWKGSHVRNTRRKLGL